MQFISTHDPKVTTDTFKAAFLAGGAPGGGVFLPESPPTLPMAFINNLPGMTLGEIAYGVASSVLAEELSADSIKKLVDSTFIPDIPLVDVSGTTYRLELFHGPTRTHKDFGARFIAGLIRLYMQKEDIKVTMATSVSESTAVPVASAFADMPSVDNLLVFNHGALNDVLLRKLKDISPHVHTVELLCDRKRCDSLIRELVCSESPDGCGYLTTANAMNPAVLLVRVIFFFQAYARLLQTRLEYGHTGDSVLGSGLVFVIPDSNPAMATAAQLALQMGLPIKRTIIMPEQKIARYGRYLEDGEIGVAIATFPTRTPAVGTLPSQGIRISATLPALKKFVLSAVCNKASAL